MLKKLKPVIYGDVRKRNVKFLAVLLYMFHGSCKSFSKGLSMVVIVNDVRIVYVTAAIVDKGPVKYFLDLSAGCSRLSTRL